MFSKVNRVRTGKKGDTEALEINSYKYKKIQINIVVA
jgi:hypothetical protein